MKKTRLFGFEFAFHFSVRKVKRLVIPIPDWADDTHLRQGPRTDEWGTPDGKPKVCYWRGSQVYWVDIPECKKAVEVSVTPLYKKDRSGYETNRKIIVDLYY